MGGVMKMKSLWRNYRDTIILLGAVILGAIVGAIWGSGAAVLKPLGNIFLNLMLVIIVPLIFVTTAFAIAKMKQPKRLGKIMYTIVIVIVITSLVAVIFGVAVTTPFKLVDPSDSELIKSDLGGGEEAAVTEELSILDRTVQTLTVGDFTDLLSRNNLIALIVMSILTGIAIHMTGEAGEPVVKLLGSINEVLMKLIKIIMYYAPIGLGCYMAALVGTFGGEIAVGYAKTFVIYTVTSIVFMFVIYTVYAFIAGGRKCVSAYWRNMVPPIVTSLATCSSAACIPVNVESTKKIGVSNDVAETMIPIGANLHKDGSIIGSVFKILFLACMFGVDVANPLGIVKVLVVALVASLLITAVPLGGGTISEMMIITMMGFPVASLPILTVIATIIDPPATMLNVVGDSASAVLAARIVDGKKWMDKTETESE